MEILEALKNVARSDGYKDQIVHIEYLPAREACFAGSLNELHPALAKELAARGIDQLYSHQFEAFRRARRGEHTVVVTPTASGKTLCYTLPVLDTLLRDSKSSALMLFPTKALSQDQMEGLAGFKPPFPFGIYDGDTPVDVKKNLREKARIIVTNPDMLHRGILPNHQKWFSFFHNLKYIVIDEAHSYRGLFGSHIAHVIRRLRRIAVHYGADPCFILCSATIANPKEHASRLTGVEVGLIDENGAPAGARHFAVWNQAGQTYLDEGSWLLAQLLEQKVRTITFTRARQLVERMLRRVRLKLEKVPPDQVLSYRSGYLAAERRELERRLFSGEALGVVATNALELGVDIGALDACLIIGYPGTMASTWQQAGRAGRRLKDSLAIFLAVRNPLDQFFVRHPEGLFGKPVENALIDPENPYIMMPHARCACHELPVSSADSVYWDEVFFDILTVLAEDGEVMENGGKYYYRGQAYPSEEANLRTAGGKTFSLYTRNPKRLLAIMDSQQALSEAYPGAVYLHQGDSYLVKEVDYDSGHIWVEGEPVSYYTMTGRTKDTKVLTVLKERGEKRYDLYYGQIEVTTTLTKYIKKDELTGQALGGGELNLPPQTMETTGMWITVSEAVCDAVRKRGLNPMGGLHAVEHAAIGLTPLFVMCDRNDIGGLSTLMHPDTGKPTIFIHDGCPGGVGFSEKTFALFEKLMEATRETIAGCPCEDGCPACIHSPKCSNFNRPLDKEAAVLILDYLLGREDLL